jgi:hypothetical protein
MQLGGATLDTANCRHCLQGLNQKKFSKFD